MGFGQDIKSYRPVHWERKLNTIYELAREKEVVAGISEKACVDRVEEKKKSTIENELKTRFGL